jgi:hypothetical protein
MICLLWNQKVCYSLRKFTIRPELSQFNPVHIYSQLCLPWVSCLQVSWLKFCVNLLSFSFILHALPSHPPYFYLVQSTNYETLHYEIFLTLLWSLLGSNTSSPSTLFSDVINLCSSMWGTKLYLESFHLERAQFILMYSGTLWFKF